MIMKLKANLFYPVFILLIYPSHVIKCTLENTIHVHAPFKNRISASYKTKSRVIKFISESFEVFKTCFCVYSCFYVSYNFVRVDGLFFTYWRELHRIDKTFKVSTMNTAILSHRYVICYLLSCAGRCKVSCHHLHLFWTPESFHLTHLHSVIYSFNASSVNNMADVRTDDS